MVNENPTISQSNELNNHQLTEADFSNDSDTNQIHHHSTFALEGHWQPWYNDKEDFNTNALSYYEYLAHRNEHLRLITEFLNKVLRREINLKDTNSIEFIKKMDWIKNGDITEFIANVKISKDNNNLLYLNNDGLMVDTVDYDDSELRNLIKELEKNQENLKTQLDLLTGGGWATREDLEDLKHILGAQKEDYYEADQGLRLLIANIDKRLNAIDIPDIDPWTQKITELNNELLDVKNISNTNSVLTSSLSTRSITTVPLSLRNGTTRDGNNEFDRIQLEYDSYTVYFNGRIRRFERLYPMYQGYKFNIGSANDVTNVAFVSIKDFEKEYGSKISSNFFNVIKDFSVSFQKLYRESNGVLRPYIARLYANLVTNSNGVTDTSQSGISLTVTGLQTNTPSSSYIDPTANATDFLTVETWLDEVGIEYLPQYKPTGEPYPISECSPVKLLKRS